MRPQGLAEARTARRAAWWTAAVSIGLMLWLAWMLLRSATPDGVLSG